MLIEELYDALIEAGASEAKAKAAARAIADYETRFGGIEKELGGFRSAVEKEFAGFRSDVDKRFTELRSEFAALRSDVDKEFAGFHSNTDKKFGELQAYVDKEFTDIRGTLKLHNWMLATNIGLLVAILFKVFS